jgi:hypothetical protein
VDHIENTSSSSSSVACFFTNNPSTVVSASVAAGMCLQSQCLATADCLGCHSLAMDVFFYSTILAFSHHVTILSSDDLQTTIHMYISFEGLFFHLNVGITLDAMC